MYNCSFNRFLLWFSNFILVELKDKKKLNCHMGALQ